MAQDLQVYKEAKLYKQEHIFEDWSKLSESQQQELEDDALGVNFKSLNKIFENSMKSADAPQAPQPVTDVLKLNDLSKDENEKLYTEGLELISQGKLGILLLAGGQGTRLGSSLPKGTFRIGLPSQKSLFHIQAQKIRKLQQLAAQYKKVSESDIPLMQWYVMTSKFTHSETVKHFRVNDMFGLKDEQVFFFQQGFLPCLTEDGKIIMESSHQIAKAPDGNGGVYFALMNEHALEHMKANKIQFLDCYCVDNVLAKVGDPLFAAYCYSKGADFGARVVSKRSPDEKVGVFAKHGNSVQVVEYSELDPSEAEAIDPSSGILKYNWSNICMHYFTVDWLTSVIEYLQNQAVFHIAKKKIPSKNGPVAGIKLEKFIFDPFPQASKYALFEVKREDEFAPLKNAHGTGSDCPETALDAILQLHKGWVEQAGGKVTCKEGIEVSPLVSYGGEGLESFVKNKVYEQPFDKQLQDIKQKE